MFLKAVAALSLCIVSMSADEPQLKQRQPLPQNGVTEYRIGQGKRIPCKFVNTVSLRDAAQAERVYLQTVFPVVVANHMVIPAGAYLDAKLAEVRKTSRSKGQAELFIRLGRLTMPGGEQRQLGACFGTISVAVNARGAVEPGTMADIVLQDPIVFPVEHESNR